MNQIILVYAALAIALVILWFILLRWAVRADEIIKQQQATTWFLIKLCEKSGVPAEEIDTIKKHFKIR